jgi:protein-tyrosine phosphatase
VHEVRVLFVCYGDTCRSPLAEGVFRRKVELAGLADRVTADSAGTNPPGEGGPPHRLSCAVAKRKSDIDIGHLRSRRFTPADFDRFDRIVVMDEMNRRDVLRSARGESDRAKVRLLRDADGEVADPIGRGEDEYVRTYEQIDEACERLLAELRTEASRTR